MTKRSVIIIPEFPNCHELDAIRSLYDPLHGKIAPHISIVFPFEDTMSDKDLSMYVRSRCKGLQTFPLLAAGIYGFEQKYLFVQIKEGNDILIKIHDCLYNGPLQSHLNHSYLYVPHITVGLLNSQSEFLSALNNTRTFYNTFQTDISRIDIEKIMPDETSVIIDSIELEKP